MTDFPSEVTAWRTSDGALHLEQARAQIHEARIALLRLCDGIAYEDVDADDVLRWLVASRYEIARQFEIIEQAEAACGPTKESFR
jgi:hypothetical protein